MLERQGSFRGFTQLNQASPFKRQLSLRINDLPSNLERTRSHSLEPTDLSRMPSAMSHIVPLKPPGKNPYCCDIFECRNIIVQICIIILFYKKSYIDVKRIYIYIYFIYIIKYTMYGYKYKPVQDEIQNFDKIMIS